MPSYSGKASDLKSPCGAGRTLKSRRNLPVNIQMCCNARRSRTLSAEDTR